MTEIIQRQLQDLCASYPSFHLNDTNAAGTTLSGHIRREALYAGVIMDLDFLVSIHLAVDYPASCPRVFPSNGSVPRSFHSFRDGSLCLGASYEVVKRFRDNPTLTGFLEGLLIPYLYSCRFKQLYGSMPYGERSHGPEGVLESYQEIFGVKSPSAISGFLKIVVSGKYRGHLLCPCGSGMKLRNCHRVVVQSMMSDAEFYDFNQDIQQLKRCLKPA